MFVITLTQIVQCKICDRNYWNWGMKSRLIVCMCNFIYAFYWDAVISTRRHLDTKTSRHVLVNSTFKIYKSLVISTWLLSHRDDQIVSSFSVDLTNFRSRCPNFFHLEIDQVELTNLILTQICIVSRWLTWYSTFVELTILFSI